jgi:hypothetical protein
MTRHRFHGDPARFDALAGFVGERFPDARYVADVAGGQGMLARLLAKRHGLECDVIDPRGWTLKGVSHREVEYTADMADYYDLVVGLHPDEALRPVVESAAVRPVVVVPCCNFWSRSQRLGRDALVEAISVYHQQIGGTAEPVSFAFSGPKNTGLVLIPPTVPRTQRGAGDVMPEPR